MSVPGRYEADTAIDLLLRQIIPDAVDATCERTFGGTLGEIHRRLLQQVALQQVEETYDAVKEELSRLIDRPIAEDEQTAVRKALWEQLVRPQFAQTATLPYKTLPSLGR